MSQHDYVISNDIGSAVRSDLNNALGAIATINSGATEPSTTYAYQLWMDTSSNVLKIRNSANSAWYTLPISPVVDNTVDINGGTVDGITSLSTANGTDVSLAGVSSTKFFWDASEEALGIGTSSPQSKLQVSYGNSGWNGSGNMTQGVVFGNSSTLTGFQMGSSGAPYNYINSAYTNNSSVGVPFVFAVGATERMRIDSSGNTTPGGDNTQDFGSSSKRWNDLYVGGGVYLGGTGSANYLDDYEEGTWTPSVAAGSISGTSITYTGKYVKVGDMVTFTFRANSTSGDIQVGSYVTFSGLPFTLSNSATSTVTTEDLIVFARQGFAAAISTELSLSTCGSSSGTHNLYVSITAKISA